MSGSIARAHRAMLVGQAPGRKEADNGRPFSGPAGKRLFGWLAGIGIDEDSFRRALEPVSPVLAA